ncbi:NAD(P)-dependent oxidoreductase [Kineosporia babensis]|uniref:NAD(P)H-binding protein n=1 Tax=Kineosporia babensis TaxID=499548 RepID=A0A9X1SWL6_9ACTN|nr:NAD(P)H-binding protein [Kineosporia babensis]MCD5314921.1 NAD(P)H-binding protein [Kineosporia babensis]
MAKNPPIVVTGAAGRAGQAVVREATSRGIPVIAVVRDPARAFDLAGDGVRVAAGNALDPTRLTPQRLGLTTPPRGWVSAISPFSAPPETFEGFNTDFYADISRAALTAVRAASISRLIVIGLFATLEGPRGAVLDDGTLFPESLKPFARAHATGLRTLRAEGGDVDWLTLVPPPLLTLDAPVTGGYQLGDGKLDASRAGNALSYADLAVAVLDEIDVPSRHREQVAVYPSS